MTRGWLAVAAMFLAPMLAGSSFAQVGGNLRYSIMVTKFENQAGWHGQWDIGDAWGAVMTEALNKSGRFIVLGEADMRGAAMAEQDFAAGGRTAQGSKAPATGQMTPAQLLVKGAITNVQTSTKGGSGGISFRGISIGGSGDTAEINATVYVVDSRTGQVKSSTSVVGQAGKRGIRVGYWGSALGGLTGDLAGFAKDNLGKATEEAVTQAVEFLIQQLEAIPWQGSVLLVKGNAVTINRGTREGVQPGQRFRIGSAEELVDPDTGEVLDVSLETVATIRCDSVKEKVATCDMEESSGAVEKGMTVQPAP